MLNKNFLENLKKVQLFYGSCFVHVSLPYRYQNFLTIPPAVFTVMVMVTVTVI